MRKVIKVGCCGFPLNRRDYFKKFKLVELQNTFYQPPKRLATVERLKESVPSDFEFTLKAFQVITHPASSPTYRRLREEIGRKENFGFFRDTREVFSAWERTFKIAKVLGAKIVVFQSPRSFRESKESITNLYKFFSRIERDDFILVWEEKAGFKKTTLKKLCKELDLIYCVDPFKRRPLDCKFHYFRLHGRGGYNYKYSLRELEELKGMLDRDSYVLFNNIYMKEDALRFKDILGKDAQE